MRPRYSGAALVRLAWILWTCPITHRTHSGAPIMSTLTTQALEPTETQIMNVVWSYDEALTVRNVHTILAFRGITYTTVLATMDRLVEKGLLKRGEGRE